MVDMFNGEIISYNVSRSPSLEQIYDMIDKAFGKFDSLEGLVIHSDQGGNTYITDTDRDLQSTRSFRACRVKGIVLTTPWLKTFSAS